MLRILCSSLRNSPASDTWDLRTLIVDGNPVNSATVTALLDVIYSHMQALDIKADNPIKYSITEYCHMLLLADAVGCSRGIIQKTAGMFGTVVPPELKITLTPEPSSNSTAQGITAGPQGQAAASETAAPAVPVSNSITLNMDNHHFWKAADNALHAHAKGRSILNQPLSQQQLQALRQQVSNHLELLLYVAYKLDLQALHSRISQFVSCFYSVLPTELFYPSNCGSGAAMPGVSSTSPTSAAAEPVQSADKSHSPVFSARVLAAASGSSCGTDMLIKACLQQPMGLGFGHGCDGWFMADKVLQEDIEVTGVLQRGFFNFNRGSKLKLCFKPNGVCHVTDMQTAFSLYTCYGVVVGPSSTFSAEQQG